MDYAYSQSAYNTCEEQNKETQGLLRLGNNDKNSTYELCLNTRFLRVATLRLGNADSNNSLSYFIFFI